MNLIAGFQNFHGQKVLALVCFFVLNIAFLSAERSGDIKYVNRLSFWRQGLLYETGNAQQPGKDKTSIGNTLGIEINVNPVYEGMEENQRVVLGWSLNGALGFNFNAKSLRPNTLNLGFWGAGLITEDIEFGMQYCFLGIYGYQNMALWGSHIAAAVRIKDAQFVFGRAGDGAIRGAFVPRFDGKPVHFLEASYLLFSKYSVGVRYTNYTFGLTETNEFRVFLGVQIGESFQKGKANL